MSNKTKVNAVNNTVDFKNGTKTPNKINAFQFMMNSRHNVIGSNSGGKDKKDLQMKSPELSEKSKEQLNKRKSHFEVWAEEKGGAKRKLSDEDAEEHIRATLHKRAKRLKKMLAIIDDELKNSGEEGSDSEDVIVKVKTRKHRAPLLIDSDNSSNSDGTNHAESEMESIKDETQNKLKRYSSEVNVENDIVDKPSKDNATENVNNNKVMVEHETKGKSKIILSKSKEKQNVKEQTKKKIEEETQINSLKLYEKENIKQNNKTPTKGIEKNSNIKKTRKKSLSLKKKQDIDESLTASQENKSDNGPVDELSDEEIFPVKKMETRKSRLLKHAHDSNLDMKKNEDMKKECFSPRAWRMRVKLVENEDKISDNENLEDTKPESDEELNCKELESKDEDNSLKEVKNEEKISSSRTDSKNQVKLAPIFLKQKQKKVDQNVLNAKKKFLHSGVPSKVKKLMTKSKSFQEPEYTLNIFPKISHVQQRANDELISFWELPETSLPLSEIDSNINTKLLFDQMSIGSFTNHINTKSKNSYAAPNKYKNLKQIVKEIKQEHPSYPVYKTFRLLYQKYEKYSKKLETKIEDIAKIKTKPKKGRPKKKNDTIPEEPIKIEMLMWTEKYKPQCHEDIIGNPKEVQELKSWLESWVKYSEDKQSSRRRKLSNSSDDFCSDSTKDSDMLPQKLILLVGPLGSGKTSSIYGLCNEQSVNVIEINASSKRTGKKILADLQEATQSHQVKNTDRKSTNSFFQKKTDSESDDNKKLSLLLFEDVDIVFEDQDDSFISALATLIISSKRPIILTSTDKKCPHLQKFILQYSVITFNSLTSRILGPWLQILCLVEGVRADKDMINKLVQWNKGDIRKTILQLQFWTQTGGDTRAKSENVTISERSSDEDICVDDESPDILWLNSDDSSDTNHFCHQNCAESFTPYLEQDKEGFKLSYPVNLELLWWTVPKILGQKTIDFFTNISETKTEMVQNTTIDFLESLVLADISHTQLKSQCYDEPIYNYWQTNPVNSLSLDQNFSMYTENDNLSFEITHWIAENSAKRCQSSQEKMNSKLDACTGIPYFEELSWRSKRHKSMKELLSAVPLSSILDRRAICEDYLMILRSISRTENERFATNNKRKNRFYHYLKNFNIHLNDSTYLLLCNTLATNHVE